MDKRDVFGLIYLAIGLTPAITFYFTSRIEYVAWFSNHTFIILGLALLFRSSFWAFAQLCLGLVPEMMWSVDFLWRVFTGKHLMSITQYMFTADGFNWIHLYSMQHLLFAPAAIYALFLLGGPVAGAWFGSIMQGVIMWGVSLALPRNLNINCVYEACTSILPGYLYVRPLLMISHVFVVYYLVMHIWERNHS